VDEGTFVFEAFEDGRWGPVAALEVRHSAGTVAFGRCLRDVPVRASGVGLPSSQVVEGAGWVLEHTVLDAVSLDGPEAVLGAASATLAVADTDVSAVDRVLAVLPSAAVGAFVGLGELVRDASGLKVIFDSRGVSYASQ
jgi:hypothetical protein